MLSIQALEQGRHIRKNQKSVVGYIHQFLDMFGYSHSRSIQMCMYRHTYLGKYECNYQAMAEARKNMVEEAEEPEEAEDQAVEVAGQAEAEAEAEQQESQN